MQSIVLHFISTSKYIQTAHCYEADSSGSLILWLFKCRQCMAVKESLPERLHSGLPEAAKHR